ncbi:unnamed protein product [Ectocarpus sp. 6 AP-2014]
MRKRFQSWENDETIGKRSQTKKSVLCSLCQVFDQHGQIEVLGREIGTVGNAKTTSTISSACRLRILHTFGDEERSRKMSAPASYPASAVGGSARGANNCS